MASYTVLDIKEEVSENSGRYVRRTISREGGTVTTTSKVVKSESGILTEQNSRPEVRQQNQRMEVKTRRIPQKAMRKPGRAPVFTEQLSNQNNLVEGQNLKVKLSLEPSDDDRLRVTWYKNGQPLQEANRIVTKFEFGVVSLDIIGVRPDDSGVFTCQAVNDFGEAICNCAINVQGKIESFYLFLIQSHGHPNSGS